MDQITIQVKDRQKARALVDFLKTLDFIENITSADLPITESGNEKRSSEFFALAGIWANREITLERLRQAAWPEHS